MSQSSPILIIQTDAQHHAWLGFRGAPGLRTPHLDALAKRSVTFRRTYSCSGVCVPSRVSFMTGRYPIGHGVMNNNIARRPDTEPTLGQLLRDAGYTTGCFGKTHFAGNDQDLSDDGWSHAFTKHEYAAYLRQQGIAATYPEKREVDRLPVRYWTVGGSRIPRGHYFEPVIAREAAAFIEAHHRRPFACYVSHVAPHGPFTPPPPYDRLYSPADMVLPPRQDGEFDGMPPLARQWIRQNQKYLNDDELRIWLATVYGLISMVDDNVGLLLDSLRRCGVLDRTLIVFLSDHGDFAGRYGILGKSWCMTDDLLRIPLIIGAPGIEPRDSDALVQSIDATATVLDWAGVPESSRRHGRSLMPLLTGRTANHRPRVFACDQSEFSGGRLHLSMVRDERWWYVESTGSHRELYDMELDPLQRRNLAALPEQQRRCDELRGQLLQWHLEHSGGFFEPRNAGFWEDQTLFYDEQRFCGERIAALDRLAVTS
jgi:arylsulfatase A-like enzyme